MIRAIKRNVLTDHPVGISVSIDPFVVMPNNVGDISIVVHVREDSLADLGVRLHDPALLKTQRPLLLEETRRQTHLSDVMHEAGEMCALLILSRKAHPIAMSRE